MLCCMTKYADVVYVALNVEIDSEAHYMSPLPIYITDFVAVKRAGRDKTLKNFS